MTLNKPGRDALIDTRRQMVGRLRVRMMSQREIQHAVSQQLPNPEQADGHWSLGIINSDLKALHKQWVADAVREIGEHKAQKLAELAEVKRAGWKANDMATVLRAIQNERAIIGLDAPVKTDVTSDGKPIPVSIIEVVKERGE